MTFGKRGRPPEDRLLRQCEIYRAVAPVILDSGVRHLRMRQAADAACMSVGGLYHYFPSKHELALHGLQPVVLGRLCDDFHAAYGCLAHHAPEEYLAHYLDFLAQTAMFLRPAI